jgi:transposase
MSQLQLTSWQRRRLQRQLHQTRDAALYRRTLALLEIDRGQSAAEVARMLGVARQSVYNWVDAYRHARQPSALADDQGRGRPGLLDEDDERFLDTLLHCSPQDFDYPHTSWTIALLQEIWEVRTGQSLSDDTLRRALHRLNYVWKRPRYRLQPDPQREKKTAHSPANPGLAHAQRRTGRRRDGSAALPAAAR